MMRKNHCILLVLLCFVTQLHADDWMKRLPDNTLVSVLSIPGSHDSGTGHGFTNSLYGAFGNQYARTQDINIHDQWSLGVRAFDFRPSVYKSYINVNHGIVPTKLRFNNALRILRDSVQAHPSEFAVLHILHASEGDEVENQYPERLLQLLGEDDLKDYFVPFRKDLRLKDVRGKILLLSRDQYADTPIGGFFKYWTGDIDWDRQRQAQIWGPNNEKATLYVQDYSDTHESGGVAKKVEAVKQLLKASALRNTSSTVWVYNLTSAYSKVDKLFGNEISLSDGYRDNATYTNAAVIDFLNDSSSPVGPTGIVLMDYAGVDWSDDYNTHGLETVNKLKENNYRYLTDVTTKNENNVTASTAFDMTPLIVNPRFNANNLTAGWLGDGFGAANPKENAEHYNRTFNTYQTITGLPNGIYSVSVNAFYRAGSADEAYYNYQQKNERTRYAQLYAVAGSDTLTRPLVSPYSRMVIKPRGIGWEVGHTEGNTTYYIPNDMESGEYYMHSLYAYKNTVFVAIDNNQLTLGVRKDQQIPTDWALFDDFSLTYYGNKDDAYKRWTNELRNMKENYAGLVTSTVYAEAYDQAFDVTLTNKQQAITALKKIDRAAYALAANAGLWARYQALANDCQAVIADLSVPYNKRLAITNYITQQYEPNLAALRMTNYQLKNEIPVVEGLLAAANTDVTSKYLANSDFSLGGALWTTGTDTRPGMAFSENIAEAYDTEFDLYQEVNVEKPGTYELTVKGFFRLERDADAWTLYQNRGQQSDACIYIDDNTVPLKCVFEESIAADSPLAANKSGDWMADVDPGNFYPNDMASAAYSFGAGMYENKVSCVIKNTDEKVRVGIRGNMTGANWVCFDDFRLSYRPSAVVGIKPVTNGNAQAVQYYTLDGKNISTPGRHGIYLVKGHDGKVRKVVK